MSDSFDEIRKHVNKEKEEQAKKEHQKKLGEQKRQEIEENFANQVSLYSSLIDQVLKEFSEAAGSGITNPLELSISERMSARASAGGCFIEIKGNEQGNIEHFFIGSIVKEERSGLLDGTYYNYLVKIKLPSQATKKDLENALVKIWKE